MTVAVRRLLFGAVLLILVLLAGSVAAGARVLGSSAIVPASTRLGILRIARGAGVGLAAARPLGRSEGCGKLCALAPQPDLAAAIAVILAGETKKVGAPSSSAQPPVASAVVVPSPVEAESEPSPEVETEPEPEAPVEVEGTESPLVESSEPSTDPGCPLEATQSSVPVAMSVLGCSLVASDTAADPSPLPFWGSIQCAEDSRYGYSESGGDTHLSATGEAADAAYRQLTVLDGDNFYGERCELGENDYRTGPTAFYHEGQHRVTYFSERLPANFPIATQQWQTVMQMKQAQPSDDDGSGPALEMEARGNHWIIVDRWNTVWEFPARRSLWTRFAWDVYYSQDPNKGWLQVSADLNGDGDFNDPGERSPVIHAATLQTEVEGPNGASGGLAPGDPIPSHLRVGIYHDPEISCAAPVECSVEVDNVQVVEPSS